MSKPKLTLIVESKTMTEGQIVNAFAASDDIQVAKLGPGRGLLEDIGELVKFSVDLLGSSKKIVDTLLRIVEQQFAGSSIKIQHGTTVIEVSNARKGDIIKIIDEIKDMNREAGDL